MLVGHDPQESWHSGESRLELKSCTIAAVHPDQYGCSPCACTRKTDDAAFAQLSSTLHPTPMGTSTPVTPANNETHMITMLISSAGVWTLSSCAICRQRQLQAEPCSPFSPVQGQCKITVISKVRQRYMVFQDVCSLAHVNVRADANLFALCPTGYPQPISCDRSGARCEESEA